MRIGIPTEVKTLERRVALDPSGVSLLVDRGHEVLIQAGAGDAAGFGDDEYERVGGRTVTAAADAWSADLVVKVKEPQAEEFGFFRPDLTLFCFLHLAAEPDLTEALLDSGVEAHAFETHTQGSTLPLLAPMSEIAGRAATISGADYLARGRGQMLSGVGGVPPSRVLILGLGTAGSAAARSAVGLDAMVVGVDLDLERMRAAQGSGEVGATLASTPSNIRQAVAEADLVVGAALVPGARAPILIRREYLKSMRPGSVFVDLAIDQGGCAETSRPTGLNDPVFEEEGVIHYCVTNVPGQFPRTASRALTAALATRVASLAADPGSLENSVNVRSGAVVHSSVATARDSWN